MSIKGPVWGSMVLALGTLALLVALLHGHADAGSPAPVPALPNGVAAGDVSTTSVVLWTRSAQSGTITFSLAGNGTVLTAVRPVLEVTQPVTVLLTGLTPATAYVYTATAPSGDKAHGRFQTPAAGGDARGLRFGVSGDGRGDLLPLQALANVAQRELDFFLYLGDTVYADVPSPVLPAGPATTLAAYRSKYDEVLTPRLARNYLADIRSSTAWYAGMDDHEVVNDYAGGAPAASESRFPESTGLVNDAARFEAGVQAFQEYHPLAVERYGATGEVAVDGERRFYRARHFGRDAALFILDARSFRAAPLASPDLSSQLDILRFLSESNTPGRTLLSRTQLQRLQADLLEAEARGITWKFVAIPEPIQHLGVAGAADRYEGYASERAELLAFLNEHAIHNVVFIAADVHGTLVNNLTYQPAFSLAGPQIATSAFEITTGSAAFDQPFGPTVVALAEQLGLLTPEEVAAYAALPVDNDSDNVVDDRDDFVKAAAEQLLTTLGYSPLGLDDSGLDASLLEGDYLAVHTFGWTEFEVARATQQLTVTTYGIAPYSAADLATNAVDVLSRTPAVVSRFVVTPTDVTAATFDIYLPLVTGG